MIRIKGYEFFFGLFGLTCLIIGYYLLWIKDDNKGWIFLTLAVINYLRFQHKIRKS